MSEVKKRKSSLSEGFNASLGTMGSPKGSNSYGDGDFVVLLKF